MIDDKPFESQINFDSSDSQNITRNVPNDYEESLQCIYLNPKYDFNASIRGLNKILQNKDEHFIVDGLRIIEPRVKDFIFTDNDVLVDIGLEKRIPVNMMGDGARKMVSLLTAIYDCKDSALFVTTHDVDSIKGLRDAALENYRDIVATFKLLKTSSDELKAYHYSLESLDYSINQEIEVR